MGNSCIYRYCRGEWLGGAPWGDRNLPTDGGRPRWAIGNEGARSVLNSEWNDIGAWTNDKFSVPNRGHVALDEWRRGPGTRPGLCVSPPFFVCAPKDGPSPPTPPDRGSRHSEVREARWGLAQEKRGSRFWRRLGTARGWRFWRGLGKAVGARAPLVGGGALVLPLAAYEGRG
jgi:hypothetical protein